MTLDELPEPGESVVVDAKKERDVEWTGTVEQTKDAYPEPVMYVLATDDDGATGIVEGRRYSIGVDRADWRLDDDPDD